MNQIFFGGLSALKEMRAIMNRMTPRHVFLVRGRKSYSACGAEQMLKPLLDEMKCGVYEWFDFQDNPKIEDVEKGLTLLRKNPVDLIIAVGGGSVIDMAKLLRFFYSYKGDLFKNEFKKCNEILPLMVLPTTSGTGAEATHFAVCYKDKKKYSVAHERILADVAVVYPPFSYNNPPYLTACTGVDALAQSIEAFWNVNATKESDVFAEKAIPVLWNDLPCLINENRAVLRDRVAMAAYWSGRAINITKTTAPHAFSYAFTTFCGYPHGHAVALTLPFFADINVNCKGSLGKALNCWEYQKKMDRFCSLVGIDDKRNVMRSFEDFLKSVGLENRGFGKENVFELIAKVNVQRLNNNPVMVDEKTIDDLKMYLMTSQKGN